MGRLRHGDFMRMFSSALASQALLSATGFLVGLLLIRRSSDLQYGYYILVSGALMLAVSLQGAYIAPAMIARMTRLTRPECGALTGGLYRDQRRVIASAAGIATVAVLAAWALDGLPPHVAILSITAILAATSALRREYFRMVLLAYQRAREVLQGDLVYAAILGLGVLAATATPWPALAAVVAVALASTVASVQLSTALHRAEAWRTDALPGILRSLAPLGLWSTAGAGIHWTFSQGYTYLVAATLDVRAVAIIATVRLLAMPVNLLSTGIGSLMLPLVSRWLHRLGAPIVLRRLIAFAAGVSGVALGYFVMLWMLRDWIFTELLQKQFAQRDLLLLLWSASFVLMAIHQQLLYLLVARGRFRLLTSLALLSATIALSLSYWGMLHHGAAGAPLGILAGELVNVVGIIALCLREVARDRGSETGPLPVVT